MTTNVSADELDFVQIDRKLIELAVEALERASALALESRQLNPVPEASSPRC